MVSIRPPTSNSSSPFSNTLVTVPNAPITIGIIVTCMFQFFQFPSKVEVLILLFTFFQFCSVVSWDSKVDYFASSLFILSLLLLFAWNHTTVCKLFVLDSNTWNHSTVFKLFVLDSNTWNHTTVCKLFVFDRNTWYHINACQNKKNLFRNHWTKNVNMKHTMNTIP